MLKGDEAFLVKTLNLCSTIPFIRTTQNALHNGHIHTFIQRYAYQ